MRSSRGFSILVGAAGVFAIGAALLGITKLNFGPDRDQVTPPTPRDSLSKLVALGDSYSAGEGLEPYLEGTRGTAGENRCHRSDRAYGSILLGSSELDTRFFACSGAMIQHLTTEEQTHDGVRVGGVQIHDLPDEIDVVTLTIGGNNAEFDKVLQHCARRLGCRTDQKWVQVGLPGATLDEYADIRIGQIEKRLGTEFAALAEALTPDDPDDPGDGPRVLVLGYPRLVSDEFTIVGQTPCRLFPILFSSPERTYIRRLADQLNTVIAREAIAAGFEFIEVADVFDGHEACGDEGQWITFIGETTSDLARDIGRLFSEGGIHAGNFHPNVEGQETLALLVDCYVALFPEPVEQVVSPGDAVTVADLLSGHHVGIEGDNVFKCAS